MDKEKSIDVNKVYEDDEDVFEDALEESVDEEINNSKEIDNKEDLKQINKIEIKDDKQIIEKNLNSNEINSKQNDEINDKENIKINHTNEINKTNDKKLNEINNNEQIKLNEKIKNFKSYTIKDGIDLCIKSAFDLNTEFFKDEFEFVIKFCELNYDKNIFYSLIYGTMYFIRTWMSFEQPEIEKCLQILNQCTDYVNSRRRVSSWSEYVKKVNYDSFTDEEAHAEITYGELQILLGATTFIKDQNFSSLFRGAMKFKQGYQSFRYAKEIYQNRTKWSSNITRDEFYSTLLSGSGVFHLSLANMPPKVLSILEFIGFTCDETYAVEQLRKSIKLDKTIKSNYSLMVLLVYNSYTKVTIGHGDFKLDEFEQLIQIAKERNTSSLFTNYFIGKELQLSGELQKSILKFNEIIDSNKSVGFQQINNACYWELMSLNFCLQNYAECARVANLMRKGSLWSPCVFTYIYAISLYMIKEQTGNLKLQNEIEDLLREVPKLRRRLAGKSTPIEKLAIAKVNYYFSNNNKFELPLHELIFYYNLMSTFMRNKAAMSDNLRMVEDRLKKYNVETIRKLGQTTDYCLLLTLKASYLRHMNFPSLAIETLEKIFQFSKEEVKEDQLIPFATMELAFCYMQLEQYEYAKKLLKSCINHSKYTAELILHFRAFTALRKIKRQSKLVNSKVQTK